MIYAIVGLGCFMLGIYVSEKIQKYHDLRIEQAIEELERHREEKIGEKE